jgi:hypothetical protein
MCSQLIYFTDWIIEISGGRVEGVSSSPLQHAGGMEVSISKASAQPHSPPTLLPHAAHDLVP